MWEALEQTGWVKTLAGSGWMYSSVTVLHYLAMFWFVGSFAIVDLRILGIAARKRDALELGDQLLPWAWLGFVVAIISGFLMFATDAGDWAPDKVFHIKLMLIALSVAFAIVVQSCVPKWSQATEIPVSAKIIAVISLSLWIATILSASEIPAMEGLG